MSKIKKKDVKEVENLLELMMKHFELSPECEVCSSEFKNGDGT